MSDGLRASTRARRYDSERGCYVYDIAFRTVAPLTERTVEVAEAFGLGVDSEHEHVLYRDFEVRLSQGDVVYITGDSGSGKSVLLRALKEDLGGEAASMEDLDAPEDKAIIDLVGGSFAEALELLSLVGLNDAFLFLRRPEHLSDGQRYRYRVAQLLDAGKSFWLCDEFCSTLDRETARIVAYNVQKMARRSGSTLIVATTHTDLLEDLNPSVTIRKGWGREISISYTPAPAPKPCSVTKDMTVEEATVEDYRELAYLHYRGSGVVAPLKFFKLCKGGELAGVIAYKYGPATVGGRVQAVGYRPMLEELNRDWALISRVVVHPKYRSVGLGARLVRETLPLVGRRHVELVAVMAQYNPFAEKAGMKLVRLNKPDETVMEAVEALRALGFNPALLTSRSYNERKIGELGLDAVKMALHGLETHCRKRVARVKNPYMRKAEFLEWLGKADAASLGWGLQVLGVLAQTKAYLYWCRDWGEAG
jgi:ABC-type lipoprotein export system ATPase subunit/GNAT superfamily N-acetyltransferase